MPQLLQNSPSRRNPNPCPLQNPSAGGWVLPHLAHTWTLQQHPLPQAPLTKGWLLWHQELNLCVWLVHNSTLAVRAGQTQRNKTKQKFAVSGSIPCLVRDVPALFLHPCRSGLRPSTAGRRELHKRHRDEKLLSTRRDFIPKRSWEACLNEKDNFKLGNVSHLWCWARFTRELHNQN